MKNYLFQILAILLLTLTFQSCKLNNEPETPAGTTQSASVSGEVVDNNTGDPVANAVIRIIGGTADVEAISDAAGKFSASVAISQSTNLTLIALKEGYQSDSTTVFATSGRTIEVPLFKLQKSSGTSLNSGNAGSIYLVSQSLPNIGVKESGSPETAILLFEVQDSSGVPLDLAHAVTVNFKLAVSPGGGEFITPLSAKTNASGRISLTLTSGLKAGVVQLIAEIKLSSKTITSKPVNISIHGGLPDQAHFSIAPAKFNIPGYNINGILDAITVYAGDKYSNPVKPNTSVYFTTTGGIIEGSAVTNTMGVGSVNLMSAEPRPFHAVYGKGFATVTATSADENYQTVSSQVVVLFSGLPLLTISPMTVDIPYLGTQSFTYTVKDQNDNPLAGGTSVSVSVEGDKVKTAGETTVTIPDTQSKAWTQFSFSVTSSDTSKTVRPVTISVKTTGPNGDNKIVLTGVAR